MKLWSLAGRVYREAIYAGQMSAAGSSVHRFKEKLEKDPKYLKKQGNIIQILGSFYLLIVGTVSVVAVLEFRLEDPSQWNALVTSGALSIQLLIQSGYLVMLTVLVTAEILAPDLYHWFESLPLSRSQVGSLRILALVREFLFPVGVIVIALPLVVGLAGWSLAAGLAGVVLGAVHGGFTLSLAVLASWKMRSTLKADGGDARKAKINRVLTMLVYGVGTLVVVFIMQVGTNLITRLLGDPQLDAETTRTVFMVLSLLPLPTAPASLLTLLIAGAARPDTLPIWAPVAGTVLFTGATAGLLLRARTLIVSGAQPDRATSRVAERGTAADGGTAPLCIRTPRGAFWHQLLQAATSDTQILISLIFPLMLPLLAVAGPAIASGNDAPVGVLSLIMSAGAGGWIMINALSRVQEGAGLLEASLPVRERDRVFPRLTLTALLPAAGAVLPALFLLEGGSRDQLSLLGTAGAITVIVPLAMVLKLALFGRRPSGSDSVVLDEIQTGDRFWKWALVIVFLLAATIGTFLASRALVAAYGVGGLGLALAASGGLALLFGVFLRRVFP